MIQKALVRRPSIDEPEIVGFERPAPFWRRALRTAIGVVVAGALGLGVFALGAMVAVMLAVALLIFAGFALISGRTRIILRRVR